MEILKIDGIEVHKYAKKYKAPYVFYSTPQDKDVQVYHHELLKGNKDKILKLATKQNGKERTISIDRNLIKQKEKSDVLEFSLLDNNIGHLKIKGFWGKGYKTQFDSIFKTVQKTDKLIIDISNNLGSNSDLAHYILQHFVNKPFETSRWKTPIYMPAYASWGWNGQWQDNDGNKVEPNEAKKRYNKNLVVLISEKTYSAGEDFVSAFLTTKRGQVIGRTTAGTTGNPIGFELPSKGGIQICSKRDYLANGDEFVGYGIKPQTTVEKSIDNKLLINKAIELLND